ncbi:MAG: DoxX family protein [Leptolyngbyaceae cyanobacterium CSU_1_4]|nr:DoxX family protein [Leptolyngbyaceae cyanobacterium CSU_1_4]
MTVTQNTKFTNFSRFRNILKSSSTEQLGLKIAWTILRVGMGVLIVHNGFAKLADVQGFATNVVGVIGLPYPVFLTYCAAYIEIVSALLLAIGFLTRLNAMALLLTMLIAIYFHLKAEGLHISPLEMASLYSLGYLFFLINGGGAWAIDALLLQKLTSISQPVLANDQ